MFVYMEFFDIYKVINEYIEKQKKGKIYIFEIGKDIIIFYFNIFKRIMVIRSVRIYIIYLDV